MSYGILKEGWIFYWDPFVNGDAVCKCNWTFT